MSSRMIDTFKYVSGIYNTTRPRLDPYAGRELRGHNKNLAKKQVNLRSSSILHDKLLLWSNRKDFCVRNPKSGCLYPSEKVTDRGE